MDDEKLRETIEVAIYAEKELETLLGDIVLQNEKLVGVQKKAGTIQNNLSKTNKIIDDMFKVTKLKLTVFALLLSSTICTLVFLKANMII